MCISDEHLGQQEGTLGLSRCVNSSAMGSTSGEQGTGNVLKRMILMEIKQSAWVEPCSVGSVGMNPVRMFTN